MGEVPVEKLDPLEKTLKTEENEISRSRGSKLNVISGKTSGMTREDGKILSVLLVAGHQMVKNLSKPSEITLVRLDIYADCFRENGMQSCESVAHNRCTEADEGECTLNGGLWLIPTSEECGRHKHLQEGSRDECK